MSQTTEKKVSNPNGNKVNSQTGKWLGWAGVIVGVIGFFTMRLFLGIVAVCLGVIGRMSDQKTLNTWAIVAGAVAILLNFVL